METVNGAQLAAELYERQVPVEAVLAAATIMLNNLPDELAQVVLLSWMAKLQAGVDADETAVEDRRAPL